MKIKKGDTVLITTGKDKNKIGKILFVLTDRNKVIVEGLNLKKKHIKPKKQGEKGQIVEIPGAIDASNVKIVCSKCKKATRTGIKIELKENKKIKKKICKKCGKEV